jgi:hypothetical protein
VLFDDELWACATIDGVEIGLVELECARDSVGRLRAKGRFVGSIFSVFRVLS